MQYLSSEWVAAVNDALAGSEDVAAGAAGKNVVMQSVISDRPEFNSYMSIVDGTVVMTEGVSDDAEFTVTTDYETSVGLMKGEVSEMKAVMSGKIKPSGNLAKAATLAKVLAAVDVATKSVPVDY